MLFTVDSNILYCIILVNSTNLFAFYWIKMLSTVDSIINIYSNLMKRQKIQSNMHNIIKDFDTIFLNGNLGCKLQMHKTETP